MQLSEIQNEYGDHTNRHPWGKLKILINKITNFPYTGAVFVRLSLKPWQMKTKKIMDSKLEFN